MGDRNPEWADSRSIPFDDLRFFQVDEEGTLTAINTATLERVTLDIYMSSLEDEKTSDPMWEPSAGSALNSPSAGLNPAMKAQAHHDAEMQRFTVMFCRALDACTELARSIPAWLAALADTKEASGKVPESLQMLLKPLWRSVANRRTSVDTTSSGESSMQRCIEEDENLLKTDNECLPGLARMIAAEFRRLVKNDPADTQGPSKDLKDMARKVITLKQNVDEGLIMTEMVLERLQELIPS